jgi:hypothetical protein
VVGSGTKTVKVHVTTTTNQTADGSTFITP